MASIQIAQNVVREKGQRTCAHHRGQLLNLYCETCDDVMCIKCITSIHKSHTVCELSEAIPAKKTELQNYLDKNNRAQIKQDADFTEIEMKKNVSNFDIICRDVQTQCIKLKQAVDTKTEQVLTACKEMKEGNIKALTIYRQEIQSRLDYFDDDFQAECAAALRNGSDLQVHDTLEEVRAKAKVPLIPVLGTASFSPNTNPQRFMDRYFGTLTTSTHRPPQLYKFLPEAIEQSRFGGNNHGTVSAIAATSASEVWVCYNGSIILLNVNGVIQQTIPWEFYISDACISPTTQNLWVCTTEKGVYELDVSMESPKSLLKTIPSISNVYKACSICVTMDDQVLVGDKDKITKYTKSGSALISTQPTQSGRSLVPNPKKITECSVTRNVAAISYIWGDIHPQHYHLDKYQGCSSVVVMNSNLEQIFRSNGAIPEGQRWELNINSTETMTDIQFDTSGNLIIARKTHFLILSGRGEFLTTIKTPEHSTGVIAFSLDNKGFLWAAVDWTTVKRLQYCRKI